MQRFVGALSSVVVALLVALLYALRPEPFIALALVFPTLTSVFITAPSLVVAYVAARAYSREGVLSVLFLGLGAVVFGSTALLASVFVDTEGRNFTATVFATGALLSAALSFACAYLTYLGGTPKAASSRLVYAWVPLTVLAIVAIMVGAATGALPPFYAEGVGTTALDQAVLLAASLAFVCAAAAIFAVFSSSRSGVLFWYATSLCATAVGLVEIAFSNGDLSSITMRGGWATLYLGGVLLVTSVLSAERLNGLPSGRNGRKA